ncbi:MAG: methyltransferase domain-containing protein [Bryobacteraceae bacterium]|nr:methyltransferase domain-containing protein [Bryobacteraceae bacterium]
MMNRAELANIARAEQQSWWYAGMREILLRTLDPWLAGRHIERVLEAGCGTGYFAHTMQAERNWPIHPVDVDAEAVRRARTMGLERVTQADVAALPFRDSAFDLVLSLDVLVHFARGEEYRPMSELKRVLAPGGLLALRVAALDVLRSRHSLFVWERQRFTRSRLLEAVRSCGIRVLRCTYANSLLMPVALTKFRLWEPLLRKPPSSGIAPVSGWLDRLLRVPLALEAKWLGRGIDLPLGQSLLLIGEKMP